MVGDGYCGRLLAGSSFVYRMLWQPERRADPDYFLPPVAVPAMGLRGSPSFCCSPSRIFVWSNTLFQGIYFYGL